MKRFKVIFIAVAILVSSSLIAKKKFEKTNYIRIKFISISDSIKGSNKKDRKIPLGGTAVLKFEISGLKKAKDGKFKIQVDVVVRESTRKNMMLNNLIDKSYTPNKSGKADVVLEIPIKKNKIRKRGKHFIYVTLRDLVAKKFNKYHTWFRTVK